MAEWSAVQIQAQPQALSQTVLTTSARARYGGMRGWGDIVPTKEKFLRQPQGSTSLDFPIYSATWYDKRTLGYYDYVSGGRCGCGVIFRWWASNGW